MYTYNGLGDRLAQSVDGVVTQYTLDLNAGLTQVLSDGADAQHPTNTYLYGLGRIGELQPGGFLYHLGDALGSVRQLVDTTGAVKLAQSYEPYGSVLESMGSATSAYAFTGEMYDNDIKLTFLRSRWYDPASGRFTTRDLWPGDYNRPQSLNGWLYTYADPINLTDPTGYFPTRDEVERGLAEFSCNCGWLDWKHVDNSDAKGKTILDALYYAQNHFHQTTGMTNQWAIYLGIQLGAAGIQADVFSDYAVVPHTSLQNDILLALGVSIFMHGNERFEVIQGQLGQALSIPKLKASYFSEEDLPSDIIGFYIGSRRFNTNLTSDQVKAALRTICKAVNTEESRRNSLDVFDNTYGAKGNDIAPFGQTGWRNWYARQVPLTGCSSGLCLGSRTWPSEFSGLTALREYPRLNGPWWWYGDMPNRSDFQLVATNQGGVYRLRDFGFMRPPTPPIRRGTPVPTGP